MGTIRLAKSIKMSPPDSMANMGSVGSDIEEIFQANELRCCSYTHDIDFFVRNFGKQRKEKMTMT